MTDHERIERDLDAMGRALGGATPGPIPVELALAVRLRARRRVVVRGVSWTAAAACVTLATLAMMSTLRQDTRQRQANPSPQAIANVAPPRVGPPLSQQPTSVAAIRSATRGLESTTLLDSLRARALLSVE